MWHNLKQIEDLYSTIKGKLVESASLQGVLAFVQTVEAGSFTGAGQRLHVTKSAVGKAVAQLEQRLGVRLLNRTTRSLSPTSEGLGYYEACVRALSEIEAAQSLLAARRLVPSGRLRVDVPLAFGRRCVAPVLFDISRQFPDLTIEISFNDRRVDLIEEGIDLAVRMGDLDDSLSLAARRIYAQRSAICAAPAYLEKHGRPRSIEDLANHSVIGYGRDGIVRPWTVRLCRRPCWKIRAKAAACPRPRRTDAGCSPCRLWHRLSADLAGGRQPQERRTRDGPVGLSRRRHRRARHLAGDAQPDAKSPRCRRRPDRAFFVAAMGCRMRWLRPPA